MTLIPQPYPMARTVATVVHDRFSQGVDQAFVPDAGTIENVINVAFWASLRREEGRSPKISLTYLPRSRAYTAIRFARPLPFDAATLTKLAPAVEQPGIHLLIERVDDALQVWGTTRRIPEGSLVLEVIQPGLLVVKRRRSDEAGKYANVVVMEGDEIKVIHEDRFNPGDRHAFIGHLLSLDAHRDWSDPANVTVQLATSMRTHNRGGSLLVVPADSDAWKLSVVDPVVYEVVPPYREITSLLEQRPEAGAELLWRERLRRAVDTVAGMTAVDGATVINDRYELLAFGAKIRRRRAEEPVQQVLLTRIVDGGSALATNVSELGGTRHLSAAQFAHDQRDSAALVASQDGNFTIFAWSGTEAMVGAYRMEALLL